ncbi:antirestriction protein ArdA [Dehalobacter sp.]|uniref:antirestriction protein ArdA n=1 Tax=Dehalobacter sp. TaxID=1962289 RepID=UPI002587DEA9|nr:antirestriction protein ArdA [Dehalobacter sp.]MDJ0305640.1 antirestriction protein ArdA [Dehalobacter sp.]
MSEIKITILRDDLYDNSAYIGAHLCLPATNAEIQDALEKARIDDEHPDFTVVDYACGQDYLNELLPKKASLYELDYLARRLSGLNKVEKAAFEGVAKIEKAPNLPKLINLTYSLAHCHVVFEARNDEQLGKFYVDNGFITELEEVPEKVLQYIDYKKVGRIHREAEKGVFTKTGYVVQSEPDIKVVYDSTNIPKLDDDSGYVFKLYLIEGCFEPEKAKGVWLKLPALEAEIASALSEIGVSSLFDCVFTHCESSMPCFEDVFSESEDLEMLNILSNAISRIIDSNMVTKYKAALQYEYCTDLDLAIDIAQNLDCYSFCPSLSSPEDYGRQVLLKASGFPPDDMAFKLLDFRRYGEAKMKEDGVKSTDYGLICRNGKEFVFEFCTRPQGQQMGGM